MPAKDLWSQIQKQARGRSEDEQLRILRRHLGELHDEWKGPYKDLRDKLRKLVARLEGHEATRSRSGQQDPFHVKSQGDARVVVAGLPNARFSDATALVNWQRAVKSPQELEYMRRAARIVEAMHTRILETVEPGLRKNELVAEIYHAAITGASASD